MEIGNDGNFTVTNTHTPEVIDKSVTKVWDDNNNQDGIRPEEVKVQLYADGQAVGTAITLNEANQWKHTFSDLAKYANGKEIAYTVKEVDVANGYTDKVEIGNDGNFTVTNTHTVKIPSSDESSTPSQSNKKSDNKQGKKEKGSKKLPATGEKDTKIFSIIGLGILAILAILGTYISRKKTK